jgi:hypothetical protein
MVTGSTQRAPSCSSLTTTSPVPHPAPVGELQAVAAVDPDRVGADQLELALDVEAALLEQLAAGALLGQLAPLDRTAR